MTAIAKFSMFTVLCLGLAACAHPASSPLTPAVTATGNDGGCAAAKPKPAKQSSNANFIAISDCSGAPTAPGKAHGDCPVDPDNPGGAQDKACNNQQSY